MRLQALGLACLLPLMGACTTVDMTGWTPEQVQAYEQQRHRDTEEALAMMGHLRQNLNGYTTAQQSQNAQWQAPSVAPANQPKTTAIISCVDLTGELIACKQIQ